MLSALCLKLYITAGIVVRYPSYGVGIAPNTLPGLARTFQNLRIKSVVVAPTRKTMNKSELVDQIAQKADITKSQADKALSAALEAIAEAVAAGDKVTLVGFGSFEPRDRQPRVGRNPQTGEPLEIPGGRVPAFTAGKLFKEKVNGTLPVEEEEAA